MLGLLQRHRLDRHSNSLKFSLTNKYMLKEITPTESVIANQVAARLVNEIINTAKRVIAIRAEGIPTVAAIEAIPEQTLPNGRVMPARPARPATAAISAKAINAALGESNCTLLDALETAIFGTPKA